MRNLILFPLLVRRTLWGWGMIGWGVLQAGFKRLLAILQPKGRDCNLFWAGETRGQPLFLLPSVWLQPLCFMWPHSVLWPFWLVSMYWDIPGSAISYLPCHWTFLGGFLQELIACYRNRRARYCDEGSSLFFWLVANCFFGGLHVAGEEC